MSYRLNSPVGEIVCGTASQMAALVQALQGNNLSGAHGASVNPLPAHPKPAVSTIPGGTPALSTILTALQKRPRQYIELLLGTPEGMLDSKLAPLLGLQKPAHVTAVFASLNNALKKAEIPIGQVIQRSKHFNGGGRDHLSKIRPELYDEVKKSIKAN